MKPGTTWQFFKRETRINAGFAKGKDMLTGSWGKNYIQNKITCRNSSVLAPEEIKLFNKFITK